VVQFYDHESAFLANLGHFVGAALREGSPCLVIATPAHIQSVDRWLGEKELDISAAANAGNYIALDASETLTKFMKGPLPDRTLFRELFTRYLENLTAEDRSVRCFGEMVALLWQAGNQSGAVLLEEMWNELACDFSFTLFCAYPAYHFSQAAHRQMQREISELHSCTISDSALASIA
jgi:hypothetical protein